eukprot:CAMPEP_0174886410 /NCGR_PEP_ID=MMETSP0167-20121228/1624_1 /TAXON_ID=38298 /ORGANISM="Rhodella maculata, Strain CCMP736" /LENGTH=156 /DNA_ID=CAMNT_0016122387 /DNA_START=131 /DNA_END=601 /DNA_ORIENTATION=+
MAEFSPKDIIPRTSNIIDSVFNDDFFSPFLPLTTLGMPVTRGGGNLIPRVDVSETDKTVTVVAELPGIKREDVTVSVKGDVMTLRGQKKEMREEGAPGTTFHRMERSFGTFERSMRLPKDVDPDKVNAKYTDGVLTVTFEKKDKKEMQGKMITIGE